MFFDDLAADLVALETRGLRRQRRMLESPQSARVTVDGRDYVAFCSNDYLGLAADPRLIAAACEGARTDGVGAGAERCVLGTKLATDPDFVREAVAAFGDRVVAGIDARDGLVAVEGWREGTATPADELIGELTALGVRHLVYTDISRDGMQTGINAEAYAHVAAQAGFPVVASGGVSTLDDIRALAALGDDVIEGVIAGRAIYEGAFTLSEALDAAAGEAVSRC